MDRSIVHKPFTSPTAMFRPETVVPISFVTAPNIINSLSDTVSKLSNELYIARREAVQAHSSLGQATQRHFVQHGEMTARLALLNNQLQDCYDNIVGFLNVAAGYSENIVCKQYPHRSIIAPLLKAIEESIEKWTVLRPRMPLKDQATSEDQVRWLREQSDDISDNSNSAVGAEEPDSDIYLDTDMCPPLKRDAASRPASSCN
ncbi:uncharacterized protein STEHIDRAFT_164003 [Stereum hirsutum FP-91666 SS1]|uniref:Uncharacterized protein n=1 Tax=Stereum hirsutum (strain FP-91666) TaxID=721885 RepID=R7RVK4_STEHR|nr:uncharacterized protein STEHIDRAFT_164003 [Stereum hirsutum FP-91666 SS1]EIM79111.1 hypothetical protein STEHIDRAFT_164003 [Stereum hirsutum FP-91666 SS1]